jgi:alpha-L-fucosidase
MKKHLVAIPLFFLVSMWPGAGQAADLPEGSPNPDMVSAELPLETQMNKEERLAWWREARFGMFIHWGLYAQAARHEWVKRYEKMDNDGYEKYFDYFDPDLYDPREWAKMAADAGMKYAVITAKHHEGFCLFDSKYTDYKATNTPCGKDLLREWVDAFRAEGLRVGFYYSLLDWHHPEYSIDRNHPIYEEVDVDQVNTNRDMDIYRKYVKDQVRELLTDYGRIDIIWLDYSFPGGKHGKGHDDWDSVNLLKMVRELQPAIIVNDRLDLLDVEGGWDFRSPEQFKPREWVTHNGKRVPWETCQTFSGSWGYHRDEATWKSPKQLLTLLIETVSKGGNLLLNVGPTARGTFDDRANDRLEALGQWMILHGRSIYGCTEAPREFSAPENSILTFNKDLNRLYIHILDWPMGKLFVDGIKDRIAYAQLLHDASEVQIVPGRSNPIMTEKVKDETVILGLPITKPDVEIPVIEIFLKD